MKVIHSHFIFAAGAGLIGLLIAAVYFMASVLAVAEFIISVVDFILSVGIFLVIGGVILIVGGIFFMLWSSDPSSAIMFLMNSIFLLGIYKSTNNKKSVKGESEIQENPKTGINNYIIIAILLIPITVFAYYKIIKNEYFKKY